MTSNDLVRQWHDRTTRGETLSLEEQAQLQEWYALQDRAEDAVLGLAAPAKSAATIQAQVNAALAQFTTASRRIQEVASENAALRREIAALRRQLAHRLVLQPA